jgi:hypothetical protein
VDGSRRRKIGFELQAGFEFTRAFELPPRGFQSMLEKI